MTRKMLSFLLKNRSNNRSNKSARLDGMRKNTLVENSSDPRGEGMSPTPVLLDNYKIQAFFQTKN